MPSLKNEIFINDNDITDYVSHENFVNLKLSKANGQEGLKLPVNQITINNQGGEFTPGSGNSILDSDNYYNDIIKVNYNNQTVISDPIRKVSLTDKALKVNVEFYSEIQKYFDSFIEYVSWRRGNIDFQFPIAEYTTKNGYYFETPAYAIKHLLLIAGIDEAYIDTDTFTRAHDYFTTNAVYIEIFANNFDLSLATVVNLIIEKCRCFLWFEKGLIKFQAGNDYDNTVDIEIDNILDINNQSSLAAFNDYYIETDNWGWETDADNNDIGLPYRDILKKFEITDDIIKVADSTSAIYLGESMIRNYYKERYGYIITVPIDYFEVVNFFSLVRISFFRYAWTLKEFEVFEINYDIIGNKMKILLYEKLADI